MSMTDTGGSDAGGTGAAPAADAGRQGLRSGLIAYFAGNPIAANLLMVLLIIGGVLSGLQADRPVLPGYRGPAGRRLGAVPRRVAPGGRGRHQPPDRGGRHRPARRRARGGDDEPGDRQGHGRDGDLRGRRRGLQRHPKCDRRHREFSPRPGGTAGRRAPQGLARGHDAGRRVARSFRGRVAPRGGRPA